MFVCLMLLSYSAPKLATDDPAAQRALFDDFKSPRVGVCRDLRQRRLRGRRQHAEAGDASREEWHNQAHLAEAGGNC